MCHFLNSHNNHKIIRIEDEEELKKEKMSIEDCSKDFDENKNRIEELKKKIKNEIIKLDKLYEKVEKEVIKSYKLKHEKLIKEENELKNKLKNEVARIKENLEINLSKINEIIRKSERIMKGIKILLEDKDKKMIKQLNYISNINKNQKEMKLLYQQPMKNIKILYNENESNIKYEEYYFNGISIPKDIEFSDIEINSFKISWKIEDIKLVNIEKKEIKDRIEIRKENEKFKLIYEGNNNNYIINNLDENTNYEIRLCSFYNNIISEWTQIYKIKTKIFSSVILNNNKRKKEYINKILEWSGNKSMELIYRGTRDGMTANDFHNKCDNKGKTICLFLNDKDNIFGGYSSIPWTSNGGNKTANDCFLFTLTNIHNTEPSKFPYEKKRSIYDHSNYGPVFGSGSDLYFGNNSSDFTLDNSNASGNFPDSYKDTLGKGRTVFTGDFNNNNQYIKLKEIEVFKLI